MAFEWLLFTKVLLRFWSNRYVSSLNITDTRERHLHPSHHITISFSTHFLFNPVFIYLQSLHWSLWSTFATFPRRWPCTQALTNSRLGTIETESSIEHRFSTILRSWIETETLSPRERVRKPTDKSWHPSWEPTETDAKDYWNVSDGTNSCTQRKYSITFVDSMTWPTNIGESLAKNRETVTTPTWSYASMLRLYHHFHDFVRFFTVSERLCTS